MSTRGFERTEATGIESASGKLCAVLIEFPDLRLVRTASEAGYSASRARIPADRWPEVVELARTRGLRGAATVFGVSHETIRSIVARTAGGIGINEA